MRQQVALHLFLLKNSFAMKYLTIFILICFFTSCQSRSAEDSYYMASPEEKSSYLEDADQPSPGDLKMEVERMIIKTAEIRFQVEDLKTSTKKIEEITAQFGGLVSSMNQTNSDYSLENFITIRMPADKFDVFMEQIGKESIYTNYTRINSEDVTEEYQDISTRLKTKKEVRDRYIDILRNKAKTVEDILAAEEKIRVIQEEIESVEGRLKFLNDKTALSTINIAIYQEVDYVKPPQVFRKPFFTKLKEGFVNGWVLIQQIIVGLVTIWPILLILALLYFFRKRIRSLFGKKS